MPKLRHVALQVKDPETTATFFEEAFEMKRIGRTDAGISHGIYLSDGTINLAVLHFKTGVGTEGQAAEGAESKG